MLGKKLVTHQTGDEGKVVERLLIERCVKILKEFYVGITIDRSTQRASLIMSSVGGMDIEAVAVETPQKIKTYTLEDAENIDQDLVQSIFSEMDVAGKLYPSIVETLSKLYRVFVQNDASLVEINPLALTKDNELVAVDAKLSIDDNALFRHPELTDLQDLSEEDPIELEARRVGLNYISLDGNIGCLVNGAGLAMATMDIIKFHGGSPANFLDVGGGATLEQVASAFRIMLRHSGLRAILVNIFGGIMRCDVIARGIIEAARRTNIDIPVVIRLEGTGVEDARKLLQKSRLNFVESLNMGDAAEKVVDLAKGR